MSLKTALLNVPTITGDIAANTERTIEYFRTSADNGARLVLSTELALTGYARSEFENLAEEADGEHVTRLAQECERLGITGGFGFVLRRGGDIHNCYALAGGGKLRMFGKFHRWWYGDRDFTPWREVELFELCGLKIGVMVCFDGRYPEISRAIALSGADVIIWPSNWPCAPKSNPEYLDIIGRARSFENQLYVALANRVGESEREETAYAGMSTLFGPKGEIVARVGEAEEILYCELDGKEVEQTRQKFDVYSERSPELYGKYLSKKAPDWYTDGGTR